MKKGIGEKPLQVLRPPPCGSELIFTINDLSGVCGTTLYGWFRTSISTDRKETGSAGCRFGESRPCYFRVRVNDKGDAAQVKACPENYTGKMRSGAKD